MQAFMFLTLQAGLLFLFWPHCSASVATDCTPADSGCMCSSATDFNEAQSSKSLVQAFRKTEHAKMQREPEFGVIDLKDEHKEEDKEEAQEEEHKLDDKEEHKEEANEEVKDEEKQEEEDKEESDEEYKAEDSKEEKEDATEEDKEEDKGENNEESEAAPAPASQPAKPPLWSATLDQAGYDFVKDLGCQYEQELFARRVVTDLGHHVCDERGIRDVVTEHFQGTTALSYEDLRSKILEGKEGKCPWLNINDDDADRCPKDLPEECPEKLCEDCEWKDVEGWHRRRTCQKKNPGFDKITNVESNFFEEAEDKENDPKALAQIVADAVEPAQSVLANFVQSVQIPQIPKALAKIVLSVKNVTFADAAQKKETSKDEKTQKKQTSKKGQAERIELKGGVEVCAGENEICTCSGTVFFGRKHMDGMPGVGEVATFEQMKTSDYKSKAVSGSIECSHAAMGGDPLEGYQKHCYCKAAAPLWSATLNQNGYDWVKNLDCQYEQELFVRRVVSDLGHHVCDERGVKDIVTKHFRGKSTLNFVDMKKTILEGKEGKCPWLNINDDDADRCPKDLPEECPAKLCEDCEWKDVGGWHRRRTCKRKNPGFDKVVNVKSDYFD